MLGVDSDRPRTGLWSPCHELAAHQPENAIAEHLDCLEQRLYYSLDGVAEQAARLATAARHRGLTSLVAQAELISLDVSSRFGDSYAAKHQLLALLASVPADSALAGRIRMVLATACGRLGERTEGGSWIRDALARWPIGEYPHWRAEALMVFAMYGVSRTNVDYAIVHHAVTEVSAHCSAVLVAATLANFAEVSAECGDLAISAEFADAAAALVRRHPEITTPLTLDSIARSRLALGELDAAEYALELAMHLEPELHCTDVQGDPWLTFAELKLARNDPESAWALLEHPGRKSWAARCSWTLSRDLKLRAEVLAGLQRWQQAYQTIIEHLAVYEGLRSVEGDRALAEFATVQIADEERRRAAEFEKLALTDPLTGLPNRRRVERWLADVSAAAADGATVSLAIIDLDHFKRVNDTYSHDSGDEVLRRVAASLSGHGGGTSVLTARLGGEEFVQLCAGASRAESVERAEQLLDGLRALQLPEIDPALRVTASIGIAFGEPTDPSGLLKAADRCLYQAKRGGRNQIVVAAGS